MKATALCITAILMPFVSGHLRAQETAAQRHEMATNQLKRLAAEMTAQCLDNVRSLEDWKKHRPELRRQLLEMLGLEPLPKRTPLKAQITGHLERDAYRIEKIVFQSLPGFMSREIFTFRKTPPNRRQPFSTCAAIRRILSERSFNTRIAPSGLRHMAIHAWCWTRMSSASCPASITARTI